MIFKKELFFTSNLNTTELLDRLESYLRPGIHQYKYQGKIDRKNNTFRILPVFDYGSRNYVRPEIQGTLIQNKEADCVSIHLKFRLPKEIATVFLVVVLLNIFIIGLAFLVPGISDVRDFMIFALIAAITGIFLIGLFTFNWKASDSAKVLKQTFNANERW